MIKLIKKNKSHRYDIERRRSRHTHKIVNMKSI